ncbi:MAG: hypothetical protein H6559_26235 [Lewinellaceae bacterium]|nr:hypothetical protein [Lewinellaceae bacterium]
MASGSKTVKVLSDTTKIEIAPSDTLLCALGEACFEVTDTTLWDCIQWVDAGGAIVGTGGELCVTPPGFDLYWYVAQVDSTLRCVIPDTAYVKVVPDSLSVHSRQARTKYAKGTASAWRLPSGRTPPWRW